MKIKLFAALCCTVVCTLLMPSCKQGQNTPDDPQKPQGDTTNVDPKEPFDSVSVAACMFFEFEASAKTLEVFDIKLQYYDENSQLQSEVYKGENVSKKIITKSLPAKTGVRFSIDKRADLDTTKVKEFEGVINFSYQTYAVNKDGQRSGIQVERGGSDASTTLPISKIDKFLDAWAKDPYYVYEFAADGTFDKKEWE